MQQLTAFTLAGALALATPAAAQVLDHADPEIVADVARGYGSVELSTDSVGDPLISGRIDGRRYVIWFYGCTDNANCKTLLMSAYWDGAPPNALQRVNDWNSNKLFGRAFVDSDGDLSLDQALTLEGGVTRANLDDWFDWWRLVLREFEDEVVN